MPDLAAGAEALRAEAGLVALEGGRHPGLGTANRIVPFGDNYLELIAIVDPDEARSSPFSHRIRRALDSGWRFAGWALRTDSIEAERERLSSIGEKLEGPFDRSRERPDGSVLHWRMLFPADLDIGLPFFIEWQLPAGDHPAAGKAEHPAGRVRIENVTVTTPRWERARSWIPESIPCEIVTGEASRVMRVQLSHRTLE